MLNEGIWNEIVGGDMMGGEDEGMERSEVHCCYLGHDESGCVDRVNGLVRDGGHERE